MNYNFTDRVRKVLAMSREEAIRLGHDYVGTEHMLLGLLRERSGVAAAALSNLSVDLGRVEARVEASVRLGKATITLGELPYTSRAKKVLEFAMAEARELSHSYVGTEHLLLGLLREEKGIAAQVLSEVGVTLQGARRETLILLGMDPDAARTAYPSAEPARTRPGMGRRLTTSMRLFAGIVTEPEKLSAEIQAWIEEREDDGFTVTDKWSHFGDGYVVITVWTCK